MNPTPTRPPRPASKAGSLLFYVLGIGALLTVVSLTALTGANLESRSATHKMEEVQALMHAEAGVEMVRNAVQAALQSGQSLSGTLAALNVRAPANTRVEFDDINGFRTLVPERIFEFTSTGRSGDARVSVTVQFRRRNLFQAGIFGVALLNAQPNVSVYGYDSGEIANPGPSNDNQQASIGSNGALTFGNNFTFAGSVILGASESGTPATCNDCVGRTVIPVGHVDPDPLGVNDNGALARRILEVQSNNNNAAVSAISGTRLSTRPGQEVVIPSGDYYLTLIDTAPRTRVIINAANGPVRLYVNGEIYFAPNNGLSLNDPFDFQIYSASSQRVRIQPNGDLSAFVYAPNANLELWPNGNMRGMYWGGTVNFQPNSDFYVDTSLQDRFLSNFLDVHAWFETRSR